MKKACIIGHPVAHSLSPKLHGYWLKKYAIDGSYEALDAPPEQVVNIIKNLRKNGFVGGNVTVPHKELALGLCDELDIIANEVGAVNTLYYKNEKLCGTNTDVAGFVENIKPHLTSNTRAVVVGAGGASRAVVVALKQLGFSDIIITNRTREKADILAEKHDLKVADWELREHALEGVDLLVNTTSLGLKNNPPLEISLAALPKHALVTDIVYAPLNTPLLAAAKLRGNIVVDGLGMLIFQAVAGFEAWFGGRPEVNLQELETLKKILVE
jgi:shikimate dehydrogenase